MNIEINTITRHFFSELNKDTEEEEKEKYISRINSYDFLSVNEINICEIIKRIPYYSNNFDILYDYDFIKVCELSETVIETDVNSKQKYLLFQYKKNRYIKFNDFLFHLKTPKMLILNVLESFSYLLNSLIKLNDNDICFFNFSVKNVVFTINYGEKPILIDFQKSIQIKRLNEAYITKIIGNVDDYTYKPLEVHVLFYLIHNNLSTISVSFIEEICEMYVKNLHILTLFSQKFKEDFKILCVNSLKQYINKPKKEIVNDILERNEKWDIYSLSLLYLHIIGNISRFFVLKGTFLSKLTVELIKNIHPDPLKRESLENTLETYEKLYHDFKDWSFITKIPIEKMNKLFQVLSG